MDLLERSILLLIGCVLGYILARIVDYLREIKEEVDEVLDIERHKQDERGTAKITTVVLVFVVALTAFAAFSSQKATNDGQSAQNRVAAISVCNKEFLGKTIVALNERTTYTQELATANIELQKSQAAFYALLLGDPPPSEQASRDAAERYLDDLTTFVTVSEKSKLKVSTNPYPTPEEFSHCLDEKDPK